MKYRALLAIGVLLALAGNAHAQFKGPDQRGFSAELVSSALPLFIPTPATSAEGVGFTCWSSTIYFPANLAGTVATCGTNPGEGDAWLLKVGGSTKATLTLSTSCVLTLSSQGPFTCSSGQAFQLVAPGTVSGTFIRFTIPVARGNVPAPR